MNEEKMLEHIRNKCYEVIQLRDFYNDYKTKLIEETNRKSDGSQLLPVR